MSKKATKNLHILVVTAIVITAYFKVPQVYAKKKAQGFCASLKIGESAKGIRERAIAFGASDKFSPSIQDSFYDQETGTYDKSFAAIFIATAVQERHVCDITIRGGDNETIKRVGYFYIPTLY